MKKKPDPERRKFIRKAVYAAPVITSFTLGALAQDCGQGMGMDMGMGMMEGCSPMVP